MTDKAPSWVLIAVPTPATGQMTKGVTLALSSEALIGLFFLQRYRFLTIKQFAKASGLSSHHSQDLLLILENRRLLSNFGGVPIPGHGKTPKAYYLTRKGFEMLRREGDIPDELLGSYVETARESSWSPQMYHRLRLVDLMLALEVQVRGRPHLNLVKAFLEYRRRKKEGRECQRYRPQNRFENVAAKVPF